MSVDRGLPAGVKGAPDWLPPDAAAFEFVEQAFLSTARAAGYERIRTPVFEHTEVFLRGVGGSTDIVQKEMYSFTDKGERSLTLRPEGTAGVMRAALEAGVPKSGSLPVKWSYAGEFFRQERPQAGRQRQFNQVGIEALGSVDPYLDAEVVLLGWRALRRAGVADLTLRLNTLGDREDRPAYLEALNAYLDRFDGLPPEVQERRKLNPLRAFDSKAPGMGAIMAEAPVLADHVSAEAREHHGVVVGLLEAQGVPITHDPRLVRGLDYYTRTAWEFTVPGYSTVAGGGRYNRLVAEVGGPETPGVGFAGGIERALLVLSEQGAQAEADRRLDAFVAVAEPDASIPAVQLLHRLRKAGVRADRDYQQKGLKAQFKLADRFRARFVLILGSSELESGVVSVKDLDSGEQVSVPDSDIVEYIQARVRRA